MSKFIVANLASALVLMAAGSVFAAPDSSSPAAPTDQSPAAAAPAVQPPANPSDAQTPAPKPAPAQAAKTKSPSDIICKPDVGTGSRVGGVKICLTREQWKERED